MLRLASQSSSAPPKPFHHLQIKSPQWTNKFISKRFFKDEIKNRINALNSKESNETTKSEETVNDMESLLKQFVEKLGDAEAKRGKRSPLETHEEEEDADEEVDEGEDAEEDELEDVEEEKEALYAMAEVEATDDAPFDEALDIEATPDMHRKIPLEEAEAAMREIFTLRDIKGDGELKYFDYYPKKVQNWVANMAMTKGRYDKEGFWVPDTFGMEEIRQFRQSIIKEHQRTNAPQPRILPEDLKGVYRFGLTEEDLKDAHPKVKDIVSFKYASKAEINEYRKSKAVSKWRRTEADTGSAEVQIAILTTRINYLQEHLTKHKKDKATKRGLEMLISKRRKFMKYLRDRNVPKYYALLKDMKIRDIPPI